MEEESKTFTFLAFMVLLFTALLASAPSVFVTSSPENPTIPNVNSQYLVGFSVTEEYNATYFTFPDGYGYYDYDLGGYSWRVMWTDGYGFSLGVKQLLFGFLWLGWIEWCTFSFKGSARGLYISYAEINADNEDGTVKYDIAHSGGGGGLIFGWDVDTYPDCQDAWDNDELVLIHGLGISDSAPQNVVSLLLSLIFFSNPDIPFLINVVLISPFVLLGAYLIFYIIIKVTPFLGD